MKILIVGGGIGGLSASIALQQQGHETVVYERVKEMRPIGAAISVWSNGIKVLNALGLKDQVAQHGGLMEEMSYRWYADGRYMCKFPLEPLYSQVGQRAFPIARTHLQNMLLDKAGSHNVHLSKRTINYEVDAAGVTLDFDDGSTDTGDFLVIADGTHSKLRNKLTGQTIARRYAGWADCDYTEVRYPGLSTDLGTRRYVNWNGQVPYEALKDLVEPHCWTTFVGEGKRVAMMPMGENKFYFWFDASPPQTGTSVSSETYKDELRQHFTGWHEAVQRLIAVVDPSTMARIEIHDTEPLLSLTDPSGRAVIIGDAAHATTPDLGQGGCQALEDSFVLGQLFKKEGLHGQAQVVNEQLKAVSEGYQKSRAERVSGLVLRARKRAEVTHALNGMDETIEWYKELENEDGTHVFAGMSKTIMGAPIELEGQEAIQPIRADGSKPLLESEMLDA